MWWTVASLFFLAVVLAIIFLVCQKALALPFRATNDYLHKEGAPLSLDFLIPGGVYIDEKKTIGEVVRLRFAGPRDRLESSIRKISKIIPLEYRLLGTTVFYLFWVLLFLVFFRLFTWARYTTALGMALFFGAVVYLFMPDMLVGRIDDAVFLILSLAFCGTVLRQRRRKRATVHREG